MPASSTFTKTTGLTNSLVLVRSKPTIITCIRAWTTAAGIAADAYVQLFDASATAGITLGTTVADYVVVLDFGAAEVTSGDGLPTNGVTFKNGVVAAWTTTPYGAGANAATATLQLGIQ